MPALVQTARPPTHVFVNAIVAKGFELSIGFDITETVRLAILEVPERPGRPR
jgi:hypothetical protein